MKCNDLWFSFAFSHPPSEGPFQTAGVREWKIIIRIENNHSNDKEEKEIKTTFIIINNLQSIVIRLVFMITLHFVGWNEENCCFDIGHMFDVCVYLIACTLSFSII